MFSINSYQVFLYIGIIVLYDFTCIFTCLINHNFHFSYGAVSEQSIHIKICWIHGSLRHHSVRGCNIHPMRYLSLCDLQQTISKAGSVSMQRVDLKHISLYKNIFLYSWNIGTWKVEQISQGHCLICQCSYRIFSSVNRASCGLKPHARDCLTCFVFQ